MKKYVFSREFYSTEPGWEIDLYKSGDINGSWTTWRACLEAALMDKGVLTELAEYADEATLEELCLAHNIYCYVEDV